MKKILLLVLFFIILVSGQEKSTQKLLHQIKIKSKNLLSDKIFLKNNFDFLGEENKLLVLIVSEKEIEQIKKLGYEIVFDEEGKPLKEINKFSKKNLVPSNYPSLETIIAKMEEAESNYSQIAKLIDLTEKYGTPPTFEGRHMYAIKISKNVSENEDEPDILIVSNHHAREIVTPLIALNAMDKFTKEYGKDQQITDLVDNYEIWIAPTWNPDGYNYCYNVDYNWRKNRHVFSNGIGVDINRNYPQLWDSPNSGSTDPSSNTFKGKAPASEPETQTMIAFANDQKFEKVLDYHSRGREVLAGYADPIHPFDNWLFNEAKKISQNSGYGGATRRPSADGEHYQWQLSKKGAFAFLIETHTSFQPNYESAMQEVNLVWPGIIYFMERAIPVTGRVLDSKLLSPIEAEIEILNINFIAGEKLKSDKSFGRYNLFLPEGNYTVRFSAPDYISVEKNIYTSDLETTEFNIPMDRISSVTEKLNIPKNFFLAQNYPNPFNPTTTIEYSVAKEGLVNIAVFNVLGQKVADLVNEIKTVGNYKVNFNATNLTTGAYYYKLTSGNYTITRKMQLIK